MRHKKKETPAIAVFELMHHKDKPNHKPISVNDQLGTFYFETDKGQAALRLITILDRHKNPIELPKEGRRTRMEGSSIFWMSLGWYGPIFLGATALDHLVDVIKSF